VRDETTCAAYVLGVAVVLGVLQLAWVSRYFELEHGRGGLTLMLGSVVTTGVLWVLLALRSLAEGRPVGPEIDDGLTAMAVMAFLLVVLPPRAANFDVEGQVDDFSRAYLPVSLLSVGTMLGARRVWPIRRVRWVWVRWLGASSLGALALGALIYGVVGGAQAREHAVRAGVWVALGGLGAAVLSVQKER
jgi:hypothetical protein